MRPATPRPTTHPLAACAVALAAFWGCALLQVAPLERASVLLPLAAARPGYQVDDGGTVTYRTDALEVVVRPMSDDELNQLFPQESSLDEYSINPYTFGDWVDPHAGYVPNRFTVFRVTVHNRGLAKVELDPLRAVLTTDRPGEVLSAYGILAGSAPRTFEGYYRARRRPSGNEYYRFSMRMGIVRSNNYAVEKKVFNGESYDGYIVFDPLDDAVTGARLTLRDFVLKFNAFDMPLESIDLVFEFERSLVTGGPVEEVATAQNPWSEARLRSPTAVRGNAPGDAQRDGGFIDGRVSRDLAALNQCFEAEYAAGRAAEGQLDVRYNIDATGAVSAVEVGRATVVSAAVGACVRQRVEAWQFGPSGIPAELLATDGDSAGAGYVVTALTHLEFLDNRDAW